MFGNGRGDRIRTCDLYVPNVALYQTELHPDDEETLILLDTGIRQYDVLFIWIPDNCCAVSGMTHCFFTGFPFYGNDVFYFVMLVDTSIQ